MKLLISNVSWSMRLSLTALRLTCFWWPRPLDARRKVMWGAAAVFSFFCLIGINLITQAAELAYVFGDMTRMTRTMLILITNMTLVFKVVTILWRMDEIHDIVDDNNRRLSSVEEDNLKSVVNSSDKFMTRYYCVFTFAAFNAALGMAASARKPEFPLPAQYPYDTSESPAYELTCCLQMTTLLISAVVNISWDSLVATLITQCCFRLKLLALELTKLCRETSRNNMISEEEEEAVHESLCRCIDEHQVILSKTKEIQNNFSLPIFAQLSVTSFIICVTAYQLAVEEKTVALLWSLLTYILALKMQVFIYCYHGNELSVQSTEISEAAYHCLWYTCSTKIRRSLLILMIRSAREAKIVVGGLTILSLATFTGVIKASYSFFTVLQSVQE